MGGLVVNCYNLNHFSGNSSVEVLGERFNTVQVVSLYSYSTTGGGVLFYKLHPLHTFFEVAHGCTRRGNDG